MDQELMPIGRFARRCRLSVKQLRHYDQLGLLRPAWVDPDAGYRNVEEIGPLTSDCVARLGQALAAAGRQPRGPLLGLFPLD